MTDLFDSLSVRFAPSAHVAIRPRPQSRFEANDDAGGFVEEENFDTVSAPEPTGTQAAPRRGDRPADMSRDTTSIPNLDKPSTPDASANKTITETQSTALPDERTSKATQPLTQTQDKHTTDQPIATSLSESPKQTSTNDQHPQHEQPEPHSALHEIHPQPGPDQGEPATPTPPPIQTRIAPTPDTPAEPTPARRTEEPSTVVRIGRVEMRQPAPPPPAPKPPAPRHSTNNAGVSARSIGHGKGQSGGSGLTDYLGWKRR